MTGRRLLLGAALASIALAIVAVPARADDEIALSLDGTRWRDELRSPLFGPSRTWVPGDRDTRSFYVRNDGPGDARLVVSVVTEDDDRLLTADDVTLALRADGGRWATLGNGQDALGLVRHALGRHGTVRVDVRATFRWRSPNESMVDEVPIRIVVALRQAGPTDDAAPVPDAALPDTGSIAPWWLVAAAAGCVALGVLIVVAGRRRRTDDE